MTFIFAVNRKNWLIPWHKPESGPGENTVRLIVQITCITWFATKIFGWKLWTTYKLLPVVPPFDFLEAPAPVHLFLFALSLLLLAALVFKPLNRTLLIGSLVTELLSCMLDQMRWQPWQYQFIFVLIICITNRTQFQKIIICTGFILAFTYIYSGIGKFNPGFLYLVWERMILRLGFKVNHSFIHQPYVYTAGYILAVAELLLGIGLLFFKTRKFCAWSLIAMHVFIIILLGPFGNNYNQIVWPWNILMPLHLYLVFIYKDGVTINLETVLKGWNKIVFICWGILPLLNHTNIWWDNFLSSRLYAGSLPQMIFCITDENEIEELKPYLNNGDNYNICKGSAMVNLQTWAMRETWVPPYPEIRVYKKIQQRWMEKHKGSKTKFYFYYPVDETQIKLVKQE